MKHVKYLFLFLLLLVACNGAAATDLPTPIPTLVLDEADSPRTDVTPESGLPPTWTPAPTAAEGHIFDVGGTPEPGETPQVGDGTRVIHVVVAGETLGEIAQQYGISVDDLAEANDITDVNRIEVGQQLIIP